MAAAAAASASMWLARRATMGAARRFSRQRGLTTTATARADARPVYLVGQGRVPVTRNNPEASLDAMGGVAIRAALGDADADPSQVGAVYVGNMMSGILSDQQHLGPLLANAAGLDLVEAATAEACCGAGGAALRWGYLAVASGAHETVVVCGVERMTHRSMPDTTHALATASHWETEGGKGETFVSLNGILMHLYMQRYGIAHEAFAPFPVTAHAHAMDSPEAVFHKPLDAATYESARPITGPIRLFDASPVCDGAAAVVLSSKPPPSTSENATVRVAGSAAATDLLPVAVRDDPLHLRAVEASALRAMAAAGTAHADIDIFELHDAYAIMACLSLENAGFVPRGEGTAFAAAGHIARSGSLPMATFGGLKARGHPVGATGVYQAAEMLVQLSNRAGACQVPGAETALIQNIGGSGASVFAHVLRRE